MRKTCVGIVALAVLAFAASGWAYPGEPELDPAVRKTSLARVEELYARRDVAGLMSLLKTSHLLIKQEVALKLGRLGANEALEELRRLDKVYRDFACAPTGEFGVAVILIEHPDRNDQKKALLAAATQSREEMLAGRSFSVADKAGRELSRFDEEDIARALMPVYTYGAQYTALAHQCRKLSQRDAIAKCIAVLEAHETPLKAEAAQDLLISFGKAAEPDVRELKARVERKIKETDPKFTIPKTIVSRCERILRQIEETGKDKT